MRPLLALCMIVKDEAHNIVTTLLSVRDAVEQWAVLDTGSTDKTPEVVYAFMKSAGLPGRLVEEPFVDFATSRNRVLDIAAEHPSAFTIMLSGDETLVEEKPGTLREFLENQRAANGTKPPSGAFCIEMRSGTQRWLYPRVLRVGAGWRYKGEVHEVPLGPNGEASGPVIPGVYIQHTASDPVRRAKRVREHDLPRLEKMANDESKTLAQRAQAIFHLGATHAQVAADLPIETGGARLTHQMIAMSLFFRYAELAEDPKNPAHDPDKAHYALALYFNLAEKLGMFSSEELVRRLEHFAVRAPRVPEMHYLLASHAAQVDARRGLLFAEQAAKVAERIKREPTHVPTDERIEWMALRIAAACAYQLGNKKRARQHAERVVAVGGPRDAVEEFLR